MAHRSQSHTDSIRPDNMTIPGTEVLYDLGTSDQTHQLQHVKHGDGHTLLVPQPSLTDASDPLRWSKWKKHVVLFNALVYSFNGGVTGPIMSMVGLSKTFDTTLQRVTYANGATLICQGVATALWMPFAIKYGRRPVYLLSNLLMGAACIWLGITSSKTYTPFILGRAFLGIFEAPIESIAPSTITDIFFLHERGAKVSFYGLSVLGGNELGPMFSSFIIQYLGMNWAFYIVAISIAISQVSMFFFMPETKFTGPRPTISLPVADDLELDSKSEIVENIKMVHSCKTSSDLVTHDAPPLVAAKTYAQDLALWGKGDPNISLRKAFLAPFVLVAYPTVLWSCLVYGLALGWNVILGATTAQLFAPPPYNFNSSAQGLVFISPFVGSLVGTYLCGPFADQVANYYTKRNNGVREPEMRLPTCAIAAAFMFLGALTSGLTYHNKTHWVGPIVGFGILCAGGQMGATLAMSYSLDCHKDLSVELMVTIAALKSLIAWTWTWIINDWIEKDGMLKVYMIIAAVNAIGYLSTIYFYLKGKQIRTWLHHANLLKKAGLK
ncbi:MFS general substrate transporter [Venturia nashicola]|uniref:MFS general substrate transporter n=1 Tax=Venturia nashicola TaxID=86259 RepID=A0A4Z1P1G7_9PEZI|nr:MFS general substrate transporter [Venturia nashicola]